MHVVTKNEVAEEAEEEQNTRMAVYPCLKGSSASGTQGLSGVEDIF